MAFRWRRVEYRKHGHRECQVNSRTRYQEVQRTGETLIYGGINGDIIILNTVGKAIIVERYLSWFVVRHTEFLQNSLGVAGLINGDSRIRLLNFQSEKIIA